MARLQPGLPWPQMDGGHQGSQLALKVPINWIHHCSAANHVEAISNLRPSPLARRIGTSMISSQANEIRVRGQTRCNRAYSIGRRVGEVRPSLHV